jgi:valyl-tRNA synthetase
MCQYFAELIAVLRDITPFIQLILVKNPNGSESEKLHLESWPAEGSNLCSVDYRAKVGKLLDVWRSVSNMRRLRMR